MVEFEFFCFDWPRRSGSGGKKWTKAIGFSGSVHKIQVARTLLMVRFGANFFSRYLMV